MIKSFNSWTKINESIAKGKDVLTNPTTGKKHKLKYKVQNKENFILKIINDLDIIDQGKLTPGGIAAIKDYFNDEDQFTMAIGQLTPAFFKDKFIVYTILSDGELFGRTKQKIQFNIQSRLGEDGKPKYPSIGQNVEFIDSELFKQIESGATALVQNIIQTGQQTILPDPEQIVSTETEPIKNEETASLKGKKFLYTMRTNAKLYLMEFTETGVLTATTRDGSDPNGTVSYDATNKKVLWSTKLDDAQSKDSKISQEKGTPLFYDMEIIQTQDKTFLERIFTDDAFRNKIIAEYEEEYASSELTPENLRGMLFYKDGKPIFGSVEKTTNATDQTATTDKAQLDAISAQLTAARDTLLKNAQSNTIQK
jgi:hypothetical protein